MATYAFGIDVGGSGIKGALVDVETGAFVTERFYAPTPPQATPADIATASRTMLAESGCDVDIPVGITLPAPVIDGVVPSMANLSHEWAGTDAASLFAEATGLHVRVLNDADAAGIAEERFGGETQGGTVIVLTFGTGIGSAVFSRGTLVPNTELGHISLDNGIVDAEKWASASARSREHLSLEEWAGRLDVYLRHVERLFNPHTLILGGGISEHFDEFAPLLNTHAQVFPARLGNNAGIIGAALAAQQ